MTDDVKAAAERIKDAIAGKAHGAKRSFAEVNAADVVATAVAGETDHS